MIPILLDSGAFSADNAKKSIPIGEYIRYIRRVLRIHPNLQYITMDVIGDFQKSFDNYMIMRKEGLDPWPVIHLPDMDNFLDKYLEVGIDKLAVGCIAKKGTNLRVCVLDAFWDKMVDENRFPKIKVHGFGMTSFPLLKRYPWYSVDSTTWHRQAQFGRIYLPKKIQGEWRYDMPPFLIACSTESPSRKIKNQHTSNVSIQMKDAILEYLDFLGKPFGKSEMVDGELRIIEKGVINDHVIRSEVNGIFYSRFTQCLEYPRKFEAPKKGLLL